MKTLLCVNKQKYTCLCACYVCMYVCVHAHLCFHVCRRVHACRSVRACQCMYAPVFLAGGRVTICEFVSPQHELQVAALPIDVITRCNFARVAEKLRTSLQCPSAASPQPKLQTPRRNCGCRHAMDFVLSCRSVHGSRTTFRRRHRLRMARIRQAFGTICTSTTTVPRGGSCRDS